MNRKEILYFVVVSCMLFSCATLRNSACINKHELKSKNFLLEFNNQTITPAKAESFIKVKDSCIGLYIVTYNYQSSKLMLPVLKFNWGFAIYSDTADAKINEAYIGKFKLEYQTIFKADEMKEIEERFLKGKIFIGSN